MIRFDENARIFHLQSKNTSYILRLFGDYIVEHMYWGPRLDSLEGISSSQACGGGHSALDVEYVDFLDNQTISTDTYPQEYSFFGNCDLRKPAFHAQYEDGSRITRLKYISHEIFPGKPKLEGLPATYVEHEEEADTLEIKMYDALTGLVLLYRYTVFSQIDAITRNIEAMNTGEKPINIKCILSCNIDFSRMDFDFIDLSGTWTRETHIGRRPLQYGTTKVESRRGTSSHRHSPFFALVDHDTNETCGNAYGFSLVYSGNFEAGVEVDTYGSVRAFMGINSFDFNWLLESGQRFVTPEVVLVYSGNGIGAMSQTYHKLYRTRLAKGKWRDLERPVLINNWEATYFDFDEDKIVEIARCAQKAGIEMMVLDDGWFGKRDDDKSSLGDWYPNTKKLPNGISGLAQRIENLGMKFGLWVEPEMVSPDSNLYRNHPNWCLHVPNRGRSLARNQLVLDLSREDVQDFIISTLTELLSSAPISYIKWDMNRNLTSVGSERLPASRQQEVYHRYVLGLYRILDAVTSAFPEVLFEGCCGGGGRFDPGQMHYFSQYWTSDNTDAVERMYIQYGTSVVMPSVFMSAHVSAVPNHQVHRVTPLYTRGLVAMSGQLGYELDVTKMTAGELAEIAEQINTYKSIREIIHKGNLVRTISPFDGNHAGWGYVTEDQNSAVLFFFTLHIIRGHFASLIRVPGLDENKRYKLRSTGEIFSGAVLVNHGVYVKHTTDAEADIFVFDAVE